MTNPEWGVKRPFSTDYTWDFDANNAASFNIYQTWTNQFELAAYDTENKVYYARTYINYNSAYLGFD